ncbi:MAG: serine hydrolase domain-containing protein [Gemmatimonadota bacterium]
MLSLMVTTAVAAQRAPAVGPRGSTDSVDRFIRAEMARRHVPGVALAVVRSGRLVKAVGYGLADVEDDIPVTTQTVFKIGSVSKQFLASGVMLLAQDGKVNIDDPVEKYIAGTPETWRGITLRHLLSHTSGILREGPAFDPYKVQADSVVIQSAFAAALDFPTGSKWQYCNVCYFTLAEVIARVSGKPWPAFMEERIFAPLAMTATRTTTTTDLVPHRAHGYAWRNNRYVNTEEYLALRPSGAFLSTVLDLAKWDMALEDGRVLTAATEEAMWTPIGLTGGARYAYGFGWSLDSLGTHRQVHHGGALPGFRAEFARFPADHLTVIVLTNSDSGSPDELARGVAQIYLGR